MRKTRFEEVLPCESDFNDYLTMTGNINDVDSVCFRMEGSSVFPSKGALIALRDRLNEVLGDVQEKPQSLSLQDHADALVGSTVSLTVVGETTEMRGSDGSVVYTLTIDTIKVCEVTIPAEPEGATEWQMYDEHNDTPSGRWTHKPNSPFYPTWEEFVRDARRQGRKVRVLTEIPLG